MDPEWVGKVYDRLPQLVLELDPDPVTRGADYLQESTATVRGYLNEVGVYLQQVLRKKAELKSDLGAAEGAYEIASNDLMVNDERVSRLPAVRDRLAMIAVILADEYKSLLEKRQAVEDLGYIEKAIRHRQGELKDTVSNIRIQASLFKADIRTGSFYGDESNKPRRDDLDDVGSDEIDELIAKANSRDAKILNNDNPLGDDFDIDDFMPQSEASEASEASSESDKATGSNQDLEDSESDLLLCGECEGPLTETSSGLVCQNCYDSETRPEIQKSEASGETKEDADLLAFSDEDDEFLDVLESL